MRIQLTAVKDWKFSLKEPYLHIAFVAQNYRDKWLIFTQLHTFLLLMLTT